MAVMPPVDIRTKIPDKVQLQKGDLLVDYKLIDLLKGWPLRVQFSGQNVGIRLLGEWAEIQGLEDVVLDEFYVDVAVTGRKYWSTVKSISWILSS